MAADSALTSQVDLSTCCILDGYFAQQFAAGKLPDYGYPKNHLPETDLDFLEVETGFMAAGTDK